MANTTFSFLTKLHSIVPGRTANIASSTNATPIVVTRTAATALNVAGTNNGNPDLVTTTAAHGLYDGDIVTGASSVGDTSINTSMYILVVSPTQFQCFTTAWVPIAGNGVWTSGGTITPWLWNDGDLVTVASHATNTNANGTWTAQSDSSTVTTLTGQYDLSNSVGNGVGGATGTIVSGYGGYSSVAGLDISGITLTAGGATSGWPTLRIRVKQLLGGNATFLVQDSITAFAAQQNIAAFEVNAGGGISKVADYNIVIPYRELARVRFGTGSAKLRIKAEVDTTVTVLTYDAYLQY